MRTYGQYCSIAKALDVAGDRWTLLIVRELLIRGACRYTDLKNGLPGIATNLLSDRIRELESAGLIRREDAPPPVATTVFHLTETGAELQPVLDALGRWGVRYMSQPVPGDQFRGHWFAFPASLFLHDRDPGGPPVSIELRTCGDPVVIEVSGGSVTTRLGAAAAPDLVLRGEPQLILALFAGQRTAAEVAGDGLEISGDAGVLERVRPAPRRPWFRRTPRGSRARTEGAVTMARGLRSAVIGGSGVLAAVGLAACGSGGSQAAAAGGRYPAGWHRPRGAGCVHGEHQQKTAAFRLAETVSVKNSAGSAQHASVSGSGDVDFTASSFRVSLNVPSGGSITWCGRRDGIRSGARGRAGPGAGAQAVAEPEPQQVSQARLGAKAAGPSGRKPGLSGPPPPGPGWVDAHHLVRQIRYRIPVPAASTGAAAGTATATITFSRYGVPVHVSPPPASETADVTASCSSGPGLGEPQRARGRQPCYLAGRASP